MPLCPLRMRRMQRSKIETVLTPVISFRVAAAMRFARVACDALCARGVWCVCCVVCAGRQPESAHIYPRTIWSNVTRGTGCVNRIPGNPSKYRG